MKNGYEIDGMESERMIDLMIHKNLDKNLEIEKVLIANGKIKTGDPVFHISIEQYFEDHGRDSGPARYEIGAFLNLEDANRFFDEQIKKGIKDDEGLVMGWSVFNIWEDGFDADFEDFIKEYRRGEIVDLRGFPETFELVKEI